MGIAYEYNRRQQCPGRVRCSFNQWGKKDLCTPASSNKNGGDTRSYPALGYEFIENGQSLSALQYYGGGMMGLNKNIVWIHNSLDEKVKLILAAASTAILQTKADSYQEKL